MDEEEKEEEERIDEEEIEETQPVYKSGTRQRGGRGVTCAK